ncbi:hypothetical protein GCM10022382_29630 [Microbacterium invictum]
MDRCARVNANGLPTGVHGSHHREPHSLVRPDTIRPPIGSRLGQMYAVERALTGQDAIETGHAKRARYAVGVVPRVREKFWRSTAAEPNPHS